MEQLDIKDIQGIVVRGYSRLGSACFLLYKIMDAALFKGWLREHMQDITAGHVKDRQAMNIAITYDGLQAMGLSEASLNSFPMEFQDGMTTEQKQILLGDYGASDPAGWQWGQKGNHDVHVLLLLYAESAPALSGMYADVSAQTGRSGLVEVKKLDTTELIERKEHFGFHDGISQPTIKGLSRTDDPNNTVAAGEFILGYKNEYNQYEYSPFAEPQADRTNCLPASAQAPGMKDLGINGTYLVFRQMEQNVAGFWKYMEGKSAGADGACDVAEMIKLAGKMVGRWPSGTPTALSPDTDNPALDDKNKFNYRKSDAEGLSCPIASHVRRTNPRDSIDTTRGLSIQIANKHRVLRRGRSYGQPVTKSMEAEEIIRTDDKSGQRGLNFMCINTNLTLQFEFVQNFWINNPKFSGLYEERDPVIGNHSDPREASRTGTFSVEEQPLRRRLTDLPEFITIKGGAYFFLPGIKALNFFANM